MLPVGDRSKGWQVAAVGRGRVGTVCQDAVRTSTGPATAGPGYPDALTNGNTLTTVAALAGAHQQRQRVMALLAAQRRFVVSPSPRASQRMLGRLRARTAGRLLLITWSPSGAGGVLVGPGDSGVHADIHAISPAAIWTTLNEGPG